MAQSYLASSKLPSQLRPQSQPSVPTQPNPAKPSASLSVARRVSPTNERALQTHTHIWNQGAQTTSRTTILASRLPLDRLISPFQRLPTGHFAFFKLFGRAAPRLAAHPFGASTQKSVSGHFPRARDTGNRGASQRRLCDLFRPFLLFGLFLAVIGLHTFIGAAVQFIFLETWYSIRSAGPRAILTLRQNLATPVTSPRALAFSLWTPLDPFATYSPRHIYQGCPCFGVGGVDLDLRLPEGRDNTARKKDDRLTTLSFAASGTDF